MQAESLICKPAAESHFKKQAPTVDFGTHQRKASIRLPMPLVLTSTLKLAKQTPTIKISKPLYTYFCFHFKYA